MEKRLKKITETIIGHTMIECGGMLGKIKNLQTAVDLNDKVN